MRRASTAGWCTLAASLGLACGIALAQGTRKPSDDSPHAAALQLVLTTKMSQIRAVDKGDWWLDVKPREWVVKRPFGPGTIDSTHWFNVTYRIDGKESATWFVDTARGEVEDVTGAK